ncbi:MAG: hypothetical protein PHE51_09415 [Eubacteriales bacterium]|nr:hypothetical protein [Eubacteriales bacterium]
MDNKNGPTITTCDRVLRSWESILYTGFEPQKDRHSFVDFDNIE